MYRLIALATLLISSQASAADEEPAWFREPPKGEYHNYFSGTGDNSSANKAYEAAVLQALAGAGREKAGLRVREEVLVAAEAKVSQGAPERSSGNESVSQQLEVSGTWEIEPGVKVVRARLFRDPATGRYRAYVLVEVPRKEWRKVDQPVDALWRSAIVPGWGQIWKHQAGKGYTILVSEVVLLAGAVTTGTMSSKARTDANATAIAADRNYYNNRADNLFYVSMGLAVATAGVYAYNLLDAYLAERSDVIYQTAHLSPTVGFSSSHAHLGLRLSF